jgi:hypothetical protein
LSPGRLVDGDRLAGDRRLIDRRVARRATLPSSGTRSPGRTWTRLAGLHVGGNDLDPAAIAADPGAVGREHHQAADRVARAVDRARLDDLGAARTANVTIAASGHWPMATIAPITAMQA